jgi:hypothetical protein
MPLTASLIQVWVEPAHPSMTGASAQVRVIGIARHQPSCGVQPFRIDEVAHAAGRLTRSAIGWWPSAVMIWDRSGPGSCDAGCLADVARCLAVLREAALPAPFPGASGFALDGLPPVRICGDRGWD